MTRIAEIQILRIGNVDAVANALTGATTITALLNPPAEIAPTFLRSCGTVL